MAEKENGKGIILVTGAAGFIGQALCRRLAAEGRAVCALVRRGGRQLPGEIAAQMAGVAAVDDLAGPCPWTEIMAGVESVVHLAGRAHARGRDQFFCDNLDATVALARAARAAGVRHFVFLSTIKVNGEGVVAPFQARPYTASDRPRPTGPYAVSKWRAEQELAKLFPTMGKAALTIIRPPLVYGDGAAGNLAGLKRWLEWGLPLPVPRESNRRSLVSRERLIAIIVDCLDLYPVSKLLLPADPVDRSTAELAHLLVPDRPVHLLPVPGLLLLIAGRAVSHPEIYQKLYGSLQIAVKP